MSKECALTTIDNPFNPFTDFAQWYSFDMLNGHNSCGVLAKVAFTSDQNTDETNNKIVSDAIDEIILNDPENKFVKVYKDSSDNTK